jgi:hypothetical protein
LNQRDELKTNLKWEIERAERNGQPEWANEIQKNK